jgi:hypothetical protein
MCQASLEETPYQVSGRYEERKPISLLRRPMPLSLFDEVMVSATVPPRCGKCATRWPRSRLSGQLKLPQYPIPLPRCDPLASF